jgi:hypothetical protein
MRGRWPLRIEQPRSVRNADQRARIVEHIHKQEAEHYDHERHLGRAREIKLQKRRCERGRCRNDACEFRNPEGNAGEGYHRHADQGRANDASSIESHSPQSPRGTGLQARL